MKTTKSGKNHGWRGLQRSKPVYTPLSLRDWFRASPRNPLTRPDGLVCWRKRSRLVRERFRQRRSHARNAHTPRKTNFLLICI
ncbi:hypothetical protein ACR0HX_004752 [Escherichia coli H30]